ncbi:hypothetical protein DFH06DRAFT_1125790 [Mycena polygramma]|nr:hypothetical protein DFH06DRAFT_1125788 [Mycena polygramma]KAJ7669433.1 hypothetical protein DFH06DRAFT_1125790 [Mycena polygramma]
MFLECILSVPEESGELWGNAWHPIQLIYHPHRKVLQPTEPMGGRNMRNCEIREFRSPKVSYGLGIYSYRRGTQEIASFQPRCRLPGDILQLPRDRNLATAPACSDSVNAISHVTLEAVYISWRTTPLISHPPTFPLPLLHRVIGTKTLASAAIRRASQHLPLAHRALPLPSLFLFRSPTPPAFSGPIKPTRHPKSHGASLPSTTTNPVATRSTKVNQAHVDPQDALCSSVQLVALAFSARKHVPYLVFVASVVPHKPGRVQFPQVLIDLAESLSDFKSPQPIYEFTLTLATRAFNSDYFRCIVLTGLMVTFGFKVLICIVRLAARISDYVFTFEGRKGYWAVMDPWLEFPLTYLAAALHKLTKSSMRLVWVVRTGTTM